MESRRSSGGPFAPAHRVGAILHAVASALSEIPFGDLHGIEIRRIGDLTLERDGAGGRERPARRQPVTVRCELTDGFGTVAAFSVETERSAEAAVESTQPDGAPPTVMPADPDLECVDNLPV